MSKSSLQSDDDGPKFFGKEAAGIDVTPDGSDLGDDAAVESRRSSRRSGAAAAGDGVGEELGGGPGDPGQAPRGSRQSERQSEHRQSDRQSDHRQSDRQSDHRQSDRQSEHRQGERQSVQSERGSVREPHASGGGANAAFQLREQHHAQEDPEGVELSADHEVARIASHTPDFADTPEWALNRSFDLSKVDPRCKSLPPLVLNRPLSPPAGAASKAPCLTADDVDYGRPRRIKT